jgi:hypothetical protein
METVEIIVGCWRYFFYFTFIVGRFSLSIISPVFLLHYFWWKNRMEWKYKPVKLKIYLILFFFCFLFNFVQLSTLLNLNLCFTVSLSLSILNVTGIYFFHENKNSFKRIFNNSNEINDIIYFKCNQWSNNILLEDVKKIDNSFFLTNEELHESMWKLLSKLCLIVNYFKTFILLEEPIENNLETATRIVPTITFFDYINDLFPNQILTQR